jgi:hypothetical protein
MVFKNVFSELKQPLSDLYCRFVARFFYCVGQNDLAMKTILVILGLIGKLTYQAFLIVFLSLKLEVYTFLLGERHNSGFKNRYFI